MTFPAGGGAIDWGPDVDEGMIERLVRDQMQAWMPKAIEIVSAQHDDDVEPTPPRTYQASSDVGEDWLDRTPPALVVACPGTVGVPERSGRRASYAAWWQVNVAVTAGGATKAGSRLIAQRHAAAVRRVLVHQVPGELIDAVRWLGNRQDGVGPDRSLPACEVLAIVRVSRVLDTRGAWPADPDGPAVHPTVTGTRVRVSGPQDL